MPCVELADPAAEHDGLDPLPALATRQPLAEGPGVAGDDRLAELVAVVGGAVGRLDLDLERRGQVAGVVEVRVLPGQGVARDAEVAHAVGGGAGHHQGSPAGGVDVPDATARAGLGSGERGDARREVVRLGREDDVVVQLRLGERGRLPRPGWRDGPDPVAPDGAGVVPEGDGRVVRVRLPRLLDEPDQVVGCLLTVDDQPPLEEPVAGVLAVGLGDVEQLHVRGVPLQTVPEQLSVVVQVPFIEGQALLLVQPLQRCPALRQDRDAVDRFRLDARIERVQGLGIRALCHAVVDGLQEPAQLVLGQRSCRFQQVATGPLDAANGVEAAGPEDGQRVG